VRRHSAPLVPILVGLFSLGSATLATGFATAQGQEDAAPPPAAADYPNVLLVMTDDQGWGDIRSHANLRIDTPNLDALANAGARFDRFYVSPVCAPTRAALLTGRWHPRTGVSGVTRGEETMRESERTMAEIFAAAGYRTGAFGKWHNGAHYPHDPNGQGFQEFLGFCAGHWDLYFDSPLTHNQRPARGEGFLIDHLTDKAIEFMATGGDQPWFCYVPFNTPHTPWQVPDRYWDKYARRGLPETTACAYAMVENIDTNVGRLTEFLKATRQDRNTIVIFLTDNGANTDRWDGDMRGAKGSLHEGGSRVPLFIRFPPAVPPGQTVTTLAAHIDLLPTLIELTGIPTSPGPSIDGKSLVTALSTGNDPSLEDRDLFNHYSGRGAVRNRRWRAVKNRANQTSWELYDMQSDPQETTDVAAQNPEQVKILSEKYDRWWADVSSDGFEQIATEVGHPESRRVRLPGHEAILSGPQISYRGKNGWANDWVDNWSGQEGQAAWPLRVKSPGNYGVRLEVSGPTAAANSQLLIEAGDESIAIQLEGICPGVPIETSDRIVRKETSPQTWTEIEGGFLTLPAGTCELTVKRMDDGPPIQLKSVTLIAQ
jgi:arylsulfatase A